MDLQALIEQSKNNHYKMLVIIDNNNNHDKIINAMKDQGWTAYDVTESILKLVENIPEGKVKLRIGEKIKKWFYDLPDKVILYNTNILYSPELGRLNPVGAFKYKGRNKEIIVFVEGHVSGDRIQYSQYGRDDYSEMDVSELIHAKLEDIDV
ncbi:MAG: BREX-3 system P-loop-containing protein BrxF [Bacillota bacterium]